MKGLLSISNLFYCTKAISVINIRYSLREKLKAGHRSKKIHEVYDLSVYQNWQFDIHAQYEIQCACNAAEEQVSESSTDAERHILASVSEESNLLVFNFTIVKRSLFFRILLN